MEKAISELKKIDPREDFVFNIKKTIWPRRITMLAFFFLIIFLKSFESSGYFLSIPEITLLFIFLWFLSSVFLEIFISKIRKLSFLENFYCFYLFLEYFWLTIIIYFIGGIAWIGGFFYWFTMMYANLHLPRRKAIFMVFLGILMFNELVILEFFGFSYPFLEKAPYDNIYYIALTLLVVDLFLIYVGITANLVSQEINKRNKEFETALEKLQEQQIVLKIRSDARTKNIAELSRALKEEVENKTVDLKKKVEELEKLQKLTQGREARLEALKKELKELKRKTFQRNS